MKKLFVLALISINAFVGAVATEQDHYTILNIAIEKGSKPAALAEYPFIPAGLIEEAKFNITDTFKDVKEASLVHQTELKDQDQIKKAAEALAEAHKDLLALAGWKK